MSGTRCLVENFKNLNSNNNIFKNETFLNSNKLPKNKGFKKMSPEAIKKIKQEIKTETLKHKNKGIIFLYSSACFFIAILVLLYLV